MSLHRISIFALLFVSVYFSTKYYLQSIDKSQLNEVEQVAALGLEGDFSVYLSSQAPVMVYSSAKCQACIELKKFMEMNKLPYDELDISENELVKDNMSKLGLSRIPVVFTSTKLYVGVTDILKQDLLNLKSKSLVPVLVAARGTR